jgi:hypothetical protein
MRLAEKAVIPETAATIEIAPVLMSAMGRKQTFADDGSKQAALPSPAPHLGVSVGTALLEGCLIPWTCVDAVEPGG